MADQSKEFFITLAEGYVSLLANINEMGEHIIHSDSVTCDQKHKCSDMAAKCLTLHNQAIAQVESQLKEDVLTLAWQDILDKSKENNVKAEKNIRQLKEY